MTKIQNNETSTTRPPIVVILGHVDSGKTSILDFIRESHVAQKESGGITQHIGAYQVEHKGKKITFIDTPGHEAFSAMRSRGAKAADVAVLVVDSCKGVELQTKEAISHIKKADIPLIVALNKIDRPEANPEKAKRDLAKEEILVESMGGKVPSLEISALSGKGVEELLELISLVGEMGNLKADLAEPVRGWILEAHLDNRSGIKVSLIPSQGSLKVGDVIATPSACAKVKALKDFRREDIDIAFPSNPVLVFGFESLPKAGENFKSFSDLDSARTLLVQSQSKIPKESPMGLPAGQKVLNLILKADCQGSLEAIEDVLKTIPQEKVVLNILKAEVGDINESDLKSAKGSGAKISGFRVKINPIAKTIAIRDKIRLMNFEIIYDLVEGVRKLMEGKVAPEITKIEAGKLRVLAVFLSEKNRQVLGGKVFEGQFEKGGQLEIRRGGQEEALGSGKIINLQKNKKDADRVGKGEECGILFEGSVKLEKGDILVLFKEERERGQLDV